MHPLLSINDRKLPREQAFGIISLAEMKSSGDSAAREGGVCAHLDRYMPLGSLTARPNSERELPVLDNWRWQESSQRPVGISQLHPMFSDIWQLLQEAWIRVSYRRHQIHRSLTAFRIYVLPDDVARGLVDRTDPRCRKALLRMMEGLDPTPEGWEGANELAASNLQRYRPAVVDDDSLFYLFNTLPSPRTNPSEVSCGVAQDAIACLLEEPSEDGTAGLPGLITKLFPYQRQAAATMIRREAQPAHTLDPRVEPLRGPTGCNFYYDQFMGTLVKDPRTYEEAKGGILAETMGLGKTLICLATILATKSCSPQVPPEYSLDRLPVRQKTGSLAEMAAAAVGHQNIPWRKMFQQFASEGHDLRSSWSLLEANVGSYIIPPQGSRRSRRPQTVQPGQRIRLCTATLVIVPANLLNHWQNEIASHFSDGALHALFIDSMDAIIPSATSLLQYDIIVISKQRLEREFTPLEDKIGKDRKKALCQCPFNDGCKCAWTLHRSPLKDLHFLRLIVDEGHNFASSGRTSLAVKALNNLIVERRWIVSGTPGGSSLLGVELDSAASETIDGDQMLDTRSILDHRRRETSQTSERKDLEKLGNVVTEFFNISPWCNGKASDPASWQTYVMPSDDGQRKPRSLRSLLQSLVVRHQIDDIEEHVRLAPLHNRIVYLRPSWFDRMNLNLFILALAVNAVTSERVDQDYMFHPNNRGALNIFVSNLRQATFYWTGHSSKHVTKTIEIAQKYFATHLEAGDEQRRGDCMILREAITIAETALGSSAWRALSELDEMGIFVDNFPEDARVAWSLVHEANNPLLAGVTGLSKAQIAVNMNLYASNPAAGLSDLGKSTMAKAWQSLEAKNRVPTSSQGFQAPRIPSKPKETKLAQRLTVSRNTLSAASPSQASSDDLLESPHSKAASMMPKSILKSRPSPNPAFPKDSRISQASIVGTTSAKLSYLLDQVLALHREEKILIFYEGDQIAYYIAQAFDLVNVPYLIYTNTLSISRRNSYIETFNMTERFRVMLMNLNQAAHGLHIASASRVFFVNPVWQPGVEAQATKRAHRIGQTRPVFVETLVLKDTIEDHLLQRRKGMSAQEHHVAEKSPLDDSIMNEIIRNSKFINMTDTDAMEPFRRIHVPHPLFGQGCGLHEQSDPDSGLIILDGGQITKTRPGRKRNSPIQGQPALTAKRRASNGAMDGDNAFHSPSNTTPISQAGLQHVLDFSHQRPRQTRQPDDSPRVAVEASTFIDHALDENEKASSSSMFGNGSVPSRGNATQASPPSLLDGLVH